MSIQQITEGVYTFSGLWAGRVYAVESSDGLTLVDAGLSRAVRLILEQLGEQRSIVRRILVTHAHVDHVGGLHALQARTGAQVYAAAADRDVIEGRSPAPRKAGTRLPLPETRFLPTLVDHTLQDGEIIPEVLGGLQAIATPGHTLGHLAYWQPQRRILFCGDVVLHILSRHSSGLRLPFALFTVDMAQNIRSVQRIAALEPNIICFGHGQPMMKDSAAALRAYADSLV